MPELIKTRWYPESVLKAYYRFESGALTTDSSGESHTLTAISDPAEDTGKWSGAVAFDGNDAYSAVDHADFKPTGNFTIGAWVKTSVDTGGIFQSYSANTNIAGIQILTVSNIARLISGKNNGTVQGTHYQIIDGTTNVCDGNWHFVVGTWDGSYLRIYVDGVSDATAVSWANAPAYAATNYVRLGCRNRTGTNEIFLTGSLDDVFILNGKALSDYEVLSIYRTISPGAFLMNLATNWKNN
jgi:large repetitive protein